ncbi:hypothetical protein EAF04_002838 [Stromatinia cepivora]|nr:hypothetical protein EAF04_002838 [Stromatinia cepivora]
MENDVDTERWHQDGDLLRPIMKDHTTQREYFMRDSIQVYLDELPQGSSSTRPVWDENAEAAYEIQTGGDMPVMQEMLRKMFIKEYGPDFKEALRNAPTVYYDPHGPYDPDRIKAEWDQDRARKASEAASSSSHRGERTPFSDIQLPEWMYDPNPTPASSSPISQQDAPASSGKGKGRGTTWVQDSAPSQSASYPCDTESFYSEGAGPPGYDAPPTEPKPPAERSYCKYLLPKVQPPKLFSIKTNIRVRCKLPGLPGTERCMAHKDMLQFDHECRAKVYLLGADGNNVYDQEGWPVAEQVQHGDGIFRDKLCRNPVVSEKFFCHNCRPIFYPCSFGLAFENGCRKSAQGEDPWDNWANCWKHHGIPNVKYTKAEASDKLGQPEAHEMIVANPAPSGPSKRDSKSGRPFRGDYSSSTRSYPTKTLREISHGVIEEHPTQTSSRLKGQKAEAKKERRRRRAGERDTSTAEAQRRLKDAQKGFEDLQQHTKRRKKDQQ